MVMTRRQFLGVSAASMAAAVTGCATNPVTGRRQLMFVSESGEVDTDRQWAPHQFSSNYGAVQDPKLNAYLSQIGNDMAAVTHRPGMPYNFRVLNMVEVNAYTFPGGSMGFARGLMINLEDEAQLAAVMGHELGHVNARHSSQSQTTAILTQLAVAAAAAYVEHKKGGDAAILTAGLGGIGANLLLSRYSRQNEREADALGMDYLVRSNYNPEGMVGVMDVFRNLFTHKPGAVELLFATHPMSDERYATAVKRVKEQYPDSGNLPRHRDRYMDHTAGLRRIKGAIEDMQKAQDMMNGGKLAEAQPILKQALTKAPDDYAGLVLMSKCCLGLKQHAEAERYAQQAKAVYPEEAQAVFVSGQTRLAAGRFSAALVDFEAYDKTLPGNPNTVFFQGFCHEKMGHRQQAAEAYGKYHAASPGGEHSALVQSRLVSWGYMAPPAPPAAQ